MEKTIVAISTAIGNGGISIIRMSGCSAVSIADQVFACKIKPSKFEPRKLYLGTFNYGNISDKCLCVYFKAPYSYTGEDMIEFQCHGGMTLTNRIYESLVSLGCTPATKGEFSKLAFLNGKLSLDEAEGVIDLINAESERELKAGFDLMQGGLKKQVEVIQDQLTELLAKIEVTLDYPEEDLEEETVANINNSLSVVSDKISDMLSTADYGSALKNGTRILIYGRTNAGKSSLLNSLLNYDRAIVTDIQGTTRDTLEETFEYRGFKFILIDTAGIRQADNLVEEIGINRSREMIKSADIILLVIDGSNKLNNNDIDIINSVIDKNVIVCVNKSDLENIVELEKLPFKNILHISTKTGHNIDKLKEELYNYVISKNINNNSIVITNTRHIDALKKSLEHCKTALNSLNIGNQLDLVSIDIKNIWLSLGDITGNSDNEKIIDDIFAKFCVGK